MRAVDYWTEQSKQTKNKQDVFELSLSRGGLSTNVVKSLKILSNFPMPAKAADKAHWVKKSQTKEGAACCAERAQAGWKQMMAG